MTENASFEFGDILAAMKRIHGDLRAAIARSGDPTVKALGREVDTVNVGSGTSAAPPLTIAFVGQYNAGKSTILRVLTGRDDIVIDSNVCTDAITAYDWNGARLLDTPGVRAGYAGHDKKTYAIIDRADLLVFVVTSDLFDDTIGHHFRELAFDRQHARRILLVVNKMGQDSGSPETKRMDLEKVTAPLTLADFRGVFIDARSWLEAQEADGEDRDDLLEIANIDALIGVLNAFIAEKGLVGRLSAPLFTMRSIAEQACNLVSTDVPQERAALELLHRKRTLLSDSRARLQTAMNGAIGRCVADIGTRGDEVAEAIEPGKTEKEVDALHAAAQQRARARTEALSEEARRIVTAEMSELQRQLNVLREGVLARELREQSEGETSTDTLFGGDYVLPMQARPTGKSRAEWPGMAKKVGGIAKNIGDFAARWAAGPAAEGAVFGSVAAAQGSEAQTFVYNAGKFFGVKFEPWGAVKVARAIGNAGRVISAVAGVLAVVAQIAEDRQQEEHQLQLRNARDAVRCAYRDSAIAVEEAFWKQCESFIHDFYGSEFSAVDEIVEDLAGKRDDRSAEAGVFTSLVRGCNNVLVRCNTDASPV